MNHMDLIEWRIRLYGHQGQAKAADDLGISLSTYADFEIGQVHTLTGPIGHAVPRLMELACMAIEAGLHKRPIYYPDDPRIVGDLSMRAVNCFANARIPLTISQISSMSDEEILDIQGIGKGVLKEVRRAVLKASQD